MTDRFQTLITQADANDKAMLTVVHNARLSALKAYQERPGKSTRDDKSATEDEYQDTVERLWGKYHGDTESTGRWFRDKQKAHDWYADQGGNLTYSAFTRQDLTTEGRKVLRESVLEILLAERRKTTSTTASLANYDTAVDEARLIKAKADREEIRRDDEQRALDRKWILREDADLETCTWSALTRDTIAHRLTTNLPALIHVSGGDIARIPDAQAIIDQAIADACNDIANSGEVTVEIEETEHHAD